MRNEFLKSHKTKQLVQEPRIPKSKRVQPSPAKDPQISGSPAKEAPSKKSRPLPTVDEETQESTSSSSGYPTASHWPTAQTPDVPQGTTDDPAFAERMRPFDPSQQELAEQTPVPDADDSLDGLAAEEFTTVDAPAPVGGRPALSGANCLAAYSDHLQRESMKHSRYSPNFILRGKPPKRSWQTTCIEISTNWYQDDTQILRECSDFSDHFAYMLADARRKNEVNLRTCTSDETKQFRKAMKGEADQWISNTVFSIAKRSGIPKNRLMAMRWILTWKKLDDGSGRKAKARLVVKGFTDPDLIKIRAESPTLSKVARNCLLQLAASYRMKLSMGDVKTAFLQGNCGESERDIYGELPPRRQRTLRSQAG